MMNTYNAKIDGGECGEEQFEAKSAKEALVQAICWADQGDWPNDGCEVLVSVTNVEDEDDSLQERIRIPSLEERTIDRCLENGDVLFEEEQELRTLRVIRIRDDYFYLRLNGGSRGAFGDGRGGIAGHECKTINEVEARRLGLEWGYDSTTVARKTK